MSASIPEKYFAPRPQFQSKFPLTDEQYAVVHAAVIEQVSVLVVKARAGTGKTSVLETIACNTDRHGLYIVFNKKNQEEAEKRMPGNITTRTMHGLAFQAMNVRERYGQKIFKKVSYRDKYRVLGIEHGIIPERNTYRTLQDIEATVRQFCQSADMEIQASHVPELADSVLLSDREQVELKELTGQADALSKRRLAQLRDILGKRRQHYAARVLEKAIKYWELVIDPGFIDLAIGHDHYLKLWHLSGPVLNYDFVMFDEFQDANAINVDIVARQTCQQIFVGDPEQQIYAWRGAIDALSRIKASRTCYLTQSFRFGQRVADAANAVLFFKSSWLKRVVGLESRPSIVSDVDTSKPHTIVTRGNAEIFRVAMDVAASGWQKKLHVVGGLSDAVEFVESGYWLREKRIARKIDPAVFKHEDIRQFDTWTDLETAAGSDRQIEKLIETLKKYGEQIPAIVESLKGHRSTPAKNADIIVTTCHKAKGLEFPQVILAADFPALALKTVSELNEWTPDRLAEELNILYVAATRALDTLQPNEALRACIRALQNGVSLELVEAPEPIPARLEAGFPAQPCQACGSRHFLREPGEQDWYCSGCYGLGADDPIPADCETYTVSPGGRR